MYMYMYVFTTIGYVAELRILIYVYMYIYIYIHTAVEAGSVLTGLHIITRGRVQMVGNIKRQLPNIFYVIVCQFCDSAGGGIRPSTRLDSLGVYLKTRSVLKELSIALTFENFCIIYISLFWQMKNGKPASSTGGGKIASGQYYGEVGYMRIKKKRTT